MRYWKGRATPGTPLVSLVVAAYTADSRRLRHAALCLIHSVLAQTYENWELCICDDGSKRADIRHERC